MLIIIITLIQRYTRKNVQARGAVHYQHRNPLDNQQQQQQEQESISTINAYINIKMKKKANVMFTLLTGRLMVALFVNYVTLSECTLAVD